MKMWRVTGGEWRAKNQSRTYRNEIRNANRRDRALKAAVFAALIVVSVLVGVWAQEPKEHTPLHANAAGMFEGHGDVGEVRAPYAGNVEYDAGKSTYTVAGSGENMWFDHDAFQFAWKRASGDVSLGADISFVGAGKNAHRKAVLMVRQNLEAHSVYADVAVHGVGLTSLQYRDEKGATTHEVQANVSGPKRVRIVKHGDYFTMWTAGADGKFALAGATGKIELKEPFYVGIGVCSHEKDLVEKAVFSKVEVKETKEAKEVKESNSSGAKAQEKGGENVGAKAPTPGAVATTGAGTAGAQVGVPVPRGKLYSMLEIMNAESGDRRAIYVAEGRFEAPNWMPDGKHLLFNRNGKIEKIAAEGGTPETIDTGFAVHCNNDHGISPDGKSLVVSDQTRDANHQSQIYLLPIGGGTPRLITKNAPSYWHGWSPDGKTLAFVGQRNGEFDIYTIAVPSNSSGAKAQEQGSGDVGAKAPTPGGTTEDLEEKRLTTAKGLDDGPEYTPDGKYVYFNSERTGHMQIWKMKADGSEQKQVTFGEENDWFPHFSPDGQEMVFLTYDASVTGHPENKDVLLRMMSMKDGKIRVMGKLFGGQGTINVPSWSPDGKKFAFVSYAMVEEETAK